MNQEASFTFTTPLNVNIVEMKDGEHLFVEGDISTNDIDLVNDIMTKACQESMQKQILERNMKLDIEHEAFKGETTEEKEINKTKIPAGKLIDSTVKDLGKGRFSTRVKGEINRNNPNYKSIKGNLIEKYLDAFSVAFLPIDITYEKKDGKDVRMLNEVNLLNIALTGNPCNTKAQLTNVITKSMDALEDYKKLKELDPSVESRLVVKSGEKKSQALWHVIDKIDMGEKLTPKELKLLKAAMDVADNKGAELTLAKEIYDKVASGVRLTNKESMLLNSLIYVERSPDIMIAETASKSHLTQNKRNIVGNSKLNLRKNSKMTENNDGTETDPVADAAGTETGTEEEDASTEEESENVEAEQKAMFKSISEEMKTLSGKYEAIEKDNVSLKESVSEIAKSVAKITKALSQPIHKSQGVQIDDAKTKSEAGEAKSVDPIELCC